MKWFDNTALTLVIIGALNWLLVGIFKLDIVAVIFGNLTWLSRIIYTIIGLCGLYLISLYGRLEVHPKKGVSVIWMPFCLGIQENLPPATSLVYFGMKSVCDIFLCINYFQELLLQLLSYLCKVKVWYQPSLRLIYTDGHFYLL